MFRAVACGIAVSSLCAVALLAGGVFVPLVCLGVAVIGGTVCYVVMKDDPVRFDRVALYAACVLVVALVLRAVPFFTILGGQDQGVYVSMAAEYARTGSPVIVDDVRESLASSPEAVRLYDRYNYRPHMPSGVRYVEDRYEGSYVGGVYVEDLAHSRYVFQFYPVHPLWMAMAGSVLGAEWGGYAVVMFGVLSIAALMLLVRGIAGNGAALALGLLVAVNPLHALFSKWPVSEVPALFFMASSILFAVRGWRAAPGRGRVGEFVISGLLAACFFLTRMSGFMYLPLYALLGAWASVSVDDAADRRMLFGWLWGVTCAYAVSLGYGLVWSFPYVFDIYRQMFSPLFGEAWVIGVVGLHAAYLVLLGVFHASAGTWRWSGFSSTLEVALPWVLVLAAAVSLVMVYRTGWTDAYAGYPAHDVKYNLVGNPDRAVTAWVGIGFLWYLSPFGAAAFVYLVFRKTAWRGRAAVLAFAVVFVSYLLVMKPFVWRHYYYARYLLSEAVPAMLVYTVIAGRAWMSGSVVKRRIGWTVYGLMLAFMLIPSAYQVGRRQEAGADRFIERVANHVQTGDLLLMTFDHDRIKTPLVFYEDVPVVTMPQDALSRFRDALPAGVFDRVLVLSDAPVEDDAFTTVDTIPLISYNYRSASTPRLDYNRGEYGTFHLYRFDEAVGGGQ